MELQSRAFINLVLVVLPCVFVAWPIHCISPTTANIVNSTCVQANNTLDSWLDFVDCRVLPDPTEDTFDEDHLPRPPYGFDDRVFGKTINDATKKVQNFFKKRQLASSGTTTSPKIIVVAKDGSGHFKTVQAAINRVPTKNKKRIIIYVKKGVYIEKVRIPSDKKYITLKGESASLTTIQWGDTASTLGKNGKPLSTYGSASVAVEADNFIALDISFKVNKYIIKLTLYFLSLNSHLFHNVYFIEHSSPPTFRSSWPPSRCSSNSRRQSCLLSLQFLWRPRHPL